MNEIDCGLEKMNYGLKEINMKYDQSNEVVNVSDKRGVQVEWLCHCH